MSKMNGYKIDFTAMTIQMNYKFAAAASQYGSSEYKLIKSIKADFPQMREVVRAGRVITTPRPTKRLTYENMKRYISAYDNSDELMERFDTVRRLSMPMKSPYKYVRDWFVAQFPNYQEQQELTERLLRATLVDIPDQREYPLKAS